MVLQIAEWRGNFARQWTADCEISTHFAGDCRHCFNGVLNVCCRVKRTRAEANGTAGLQGTQSLVSQRSAVQSGTALNIKGLIQDRGDFSAVDACDGKGDEPAEMPRRHRGQQAKSGDRTQAVQQQFRESGDVLLNSGGCFRLDPVDGGIQAGNSRDIQISGFELFGSGLGLLQGFTGSSGATEFQRQNLGVGTCSKAEQACAQGAGNSLVSGGGKEIHTEEIHVAVMMAGCLSSIQEHE